MTSDFDWWQKFYVGTWQDIHSSFRTQERNILEGSFIVDVLKIKPPDRILDVPCGEGRLAIELASRGYKVTGIDFNKHFLKIAKDNAVKKGLDIDWRQRDMRDIPWKNKFDAVICMWASFGYFDEKGNLEFIKAVSHSLIKGGRLLIDTPVAETLYPTYKTQGKFKIAGVSVMVNRFIDPNTSRNEEHFTFTKKGRRTSYHSSIRIYTYQEIINLLKQNAFAHFKSYGSFSKKPFQFGASRLLITAKRI